VGTIEIDEITSRRDGERFADAVTVIQAVTAESDPDDPVPGADELALRLFQVAAHRRTRTFVATLDGAPAGIAGIELPQASNRDQVFGYVWVAPDHRRRGVARALAVHLADVVARDEPARTILRAWIFAQPAAMTWCEGLGLTHRQRGRRSRLLVADVDPVQQAASADDASARARGYRVISWRGATPVEHLDQLCVALEAMADAPDDGIEFEAPTITHDLIRDAERAEHGRIDHLVSLALAPDGSAAGMTELELVTHRPTLAEQGDTAVVPTHRGLGLGRWLKAVNLARALDAQPELAVIDTHNAESNPWMLDINVDMGFRPHREVHCYQGPLPTFDAS